MAEVRTYHAKVDRDGKVWRIRVPEVARTTQARTLREVEPMARDLIAIMDNIRPTRSALTLPSPFPPTSGPNLTGPPNFETKQHAARPKPRNWHDAQHGVFVTKGCRCRTSARHSGCHSSEPSS